MNTDIKKDRSPHSPRLTLSDAISLAKELHAKAGKAQIAREVAASALGYSGLNGAALGTLGALNQYGLIEGSKGGVAISPLAIKLIHPLNSTQEAESKREAALNPRVFNDIYTGGFHDCSEDVLCNHLVQNGFTPEGAKRASSVYKANVLFANLDPKSSLIAETVSSGNDEPIRLPEPASSPSSSSFAIPPALDPSLASLRRTLARYSVPLGTNEATIVFSGESLTSEDFDALVEYVLLFKKQFLRTTATTTTT